MEAKFTAKPSWKKAPAPSIGSRSLGLRFEALASLLCRERGYRIIQKNRWLKWGEIDLWVRDRERRYVLLEVRGRRDGKYLPSEMLSREKIHRLRKLAVAESRRLRMPVKVEFLEIVGDPSERGFAIKLWWWRLTKVPKRYEYRWYVLF